MEYCEKIRNIREQCIHSKRFSSVCRQKYKESVRSAYLLQLHSIPYYHPLIPVAPPSTILPGAPPMLRRWQPHNKPSVAHCFLNCCKIYRNWQNTLWFASHLPQEYCCSKGTWSFSVVGDTKQQGTVKQKREGKKHYFKNRAKIRQRWGRDCPFGKNSH